MRRPRNVIILSAEDDAADTIVPRLKAMGADLSRVYVVTGKHLRDQDGQEHEASITLSDIKALTAAIEEVDDVALVIVDPLAGYIGADVDLHRGNEVRPVLTALYELAKTYGLVVFIVHHNNKSSGMKAIHRGAGSYDIGAAVRSILLVAENPQDPTSRVIAHLKSNLAAPGPSLGFELKEGRFQWTGQNHYTPDQLLAQPGSSEERNALDEAADWLEEVLSNGAMAARDIKRAAVDAGMSWRTVERAKAKLGVRSGRSSTGNTGAGSWLWELPRQGPHTQNTGGLAVLASLATPTPPTAPPNHPSAALLEHPPARQEPQDRKTANTNSAESIRDRVAARAISLSTISLEQLRDRYATALPHATAAPTAWTSTAKVEPLAVTAALETLAEDQVTGAYQEGSAWQYLTAARAAIGAGT